MPVKVYGIKNCNTVKKALVWLENKDIVFEFHDFKKLGVSKEKLHEWAAQMGWENLINKKGTTWKGLAHEIKLSISSEDKAFALMQEKTSLIKRPVIENGDKIIQGYDLAELETFFDKER